MLPPLAWKQVLPALLIGLLIGGIGSHGGGRVMRRGGGPDPDRVVALFSRKLNLDADQRTRLREVLETNKKKMEALRADVHPKFEALQKSMSADIRAFLRPDQIEKFEKLEQEMAARRARRGPERHP